MSEERQRPEEDAEKEEGAATNDQKTAATSSGAVSRRGFIAGAAGAAALVALGAVSLAPQAYAVRPPGAQDQARFLGACVRCGKCMEVCPNGVVVPSPVEEGLVAMRAPRLRFDLSSSDLNGKLGWCDHCAEANGGIARCAEVCPTGALSLKDGSAFDTMLLGKARIEHDWCLAWRLKGCTICKNACPLDAITFDDNNRPVIDEALCNGCGSCEQVCVSMESTSMGEGERHRAMTRRAIAVYPIEP